MPVEQRELEHYINSVKHHYFRTLRTTKNELTHLWKQSFMKGDRWGKICQSNGTNRKIRRYAILGLLERWEGRRLLLIVQIPCILALEDHDGQVILNHNGLGYMNLKELGF